MALVGLLGTKAQILQNSQAQVVIDAQSIHPNFFDTVGKTKIPKEYPTSLLIKIDSGAMEPGGGFAGHEDVGARIEWGAGGGSSVVQFSSVTALDPSFFSGLIQGMVIPIFASWVRVSILPNFVAAYTGGAFIAEGVAPRKPVLRCVLGTFNQRQTRLAPPTAGNSANSYIPKHVSRFRLLPMTQLTGNCTSQITYTDGLANVESLPAGTFMDWKPAHPYYSGLTIKNDGPDDLIEIMADFELDL